MHPPQYFSLGSQASQCEINKTKIDRIFPKLGNRISINIYAVKSSMTVHSMFVAQSTRYTEGEKLSCDWKASS